MENQLKKPEVAAKKGVAFIKKLLKKMMLLEPFEGTKKYIYDTDFDYEGSETSLPILFIGEELPTPWGKYVKLRKNSFTLSSGDCTFDKKEGLKLLHQIGKGHKEKVLKEVNKQLLKPFSQAYFGKKKKEEDQSIDTQSQILALSKQLLPLIKDLSTEKVSTKKQELLSKIKVLGQELYSFPDWQIHTPNTLSKALSKIISLQVSKSTEEKVQLKENRFFEQTKTLWQMMEEQLSSFNPKNIETSIQKLKTQLFTWSNFEEKVKQQPQLASQLKQQAQLQAWMKEVTKLTTLLSSIQDDLNAFQEAIIAKDEVSAIQIQENILASI